VYEWLSSTDRVAAKPNLSALFFAAEVLQCSGITDSFNAHMIADLFRNELAYSRGCWYVWDGRIWSRDSDQIRRRLAARVAEMYRAYAQRLQNLVAIATGAFTKKDLPYPLAAWLRPIAPVISAATKSAATVQNLRTMDAAFTIAQAHLHVASDAWDREHHLLAVYNGVVDLRTGALQAPSPHFRMTRIAGCAYNPAAVAPRFGRFLSEVQPDSEVRAYLQRLIGYAATGEAREQKFFSFVGDGGNGKGTFVSSIMDALGDYAVKANAGLLAEQAPDKPRNDLAALAGARLLSISELPANLRADAALLKSITGGDVISARFLNREFFQFRPCFTSILDTNHPLIIRENTTAAVRRRVTIPWSVTIPDEKSDSSLHERLSQELPGILAWIVEGARQYYSTGLGSLKQPVHKEPIDSFAEWLETCVRNDPAARVQSSVLYQSYCGWGNNPGAEVRLDIKAFGTALAARGFQEPKKSNGVMMWRGICLGPRQTQCS
jgi:putative DNA primase/helicase